jgi:pSer/pThr/pTyr-binding forkhead associated (FHA) protein
MSAKIRLKFVAGARKGQEFSFDNHDTFLFGRTPECHISLPRDHLVSRHHFLLEVNPPDARLRDLGSLNGTYVNNIKYGGRAEGEDPQTASQRQLPEVDLHDGDEIQVGNTVILFSVEVPAVTSVQTVNCQKCGRDVSTEAGPGRHGDYICAACRQQVQADPVALLAALLNQAVEPITTELNLPEYEVERKLGEGGMGAVYLVRRRSDGQRSALKVLLSKIAVDEQARKHFVREIEITRSLSHQNIVSFLGYGSAGGIFYFFMEFCDGGSAADLISQRGGKISLPEAAPIMVQTLEGLAYVHARSLVHRDIKPQNILLTGSQGNRIAKIADYGLAKNFTMAGWSGHTVTGTFGGSFFYMPREQIFEFKYIYPNGDVWSMGATFYHMLTGQFPRQFNRGQDPLEAILQGPIIPIRQQDASLPKPVAEVIDRSLQNNPAERYQDAGAMLQALKNAL